MYAGAIFVPATKLIMERTLIKDLKEHIGTEVLINGVVNVARHQGKMAFFDFRDRSSIIQGVIFGKPEVLEVAKDVGQEYSVAVKGIVNQRPEKMINANVASAINPPGIKMCKGLPGFSSS